MRSRWAVAFLLFAFFLTAETKVRMQDLPAAVQSAVKEQAKGSAIVGFAKERERGQTTYEVETKLNGKSRDLTFSGSGTLLEVEQEVSLNSLPASAKESIERKAAGGDIRKVESVTRGVMVSYEADIRTKAGRSIEVAVNPDGTAAR